MKPTKIKLKIFYILFFISYLKFYAKCFSCEENCKRVGNKCEYNNPLYTGNDCDACRPNLLNGNSEKCYTCSGSGNYYYFEGDTSTTCIKTTIACTSLTNYHTKRIYETYQCVAACGPYLYEMGKYCYTSCVGGNREEEDSSIKKCKCRYLYTLVSNEYTCYDLNKYCENNQLFYRHDKKQCLSSSTTSCPSDYPKKYKIYRGPGIQDITRCSKTCLKGEYIDETDSNLCLDSCGNKYYIENKYTQENRCQTTCPSNYVIVGKKCVDKEECMFLNNGISGFSNCTDTCNNYYITSMPNSNYKYCSKTCVSPTAYISEADNYKYCVESCPSYFFEYVSGQKNV